MIRRDWCLLAIGQVFLLYVLRNHPILQLVELTAVIFFLLSQAVSATLVAGIFVFTLFGYVGIAALIWRLIVNS